MLENDKCAELFDNCRESLENDFEEFRSRMERENLDRIKLMVTLLEKKKNKQAERINERIMNYQRSGEPSRIKMIPLEKGRLRKLVQSIEQRIDQLKLREKTEVNQNFVAGGVIRIE